MYVMGFDKLLKKSWMPTSGFSRRNDEAYVKFSTYDGTTHTKKKFGLIGKFFSFGLTSIKETVQTLVSGTAAIAVDASLGNIWYHILTENTTVAAPTNMKAGTTYTLMIVQHASSAKTIAFNAVFKLKGNWVKNSAVDSIDMLKFYCDGTSLHEIASKEIGYGPLLHKVLTLTSTTNAVAVDAAGGDVWNHLLTENTTLAAPSNLRAGTIYTLILTQDAAAAKTVAFNAVFKMKGNWVKNAALDSVDVLKFYSDGTNLYELSATSIAYAPLQRGKVVLTSDTAAVAINAALGDYWYHLTTENTTLAAPTNLKAGARYTLHLLQDASAAKTLAFNAVFKLVGGSFTITAVAAKTDMLEFISDGTNLYEVGRAQDLS